MTTELKQYIETELLPTVGIVEETVPAIQTLHDMIHWIEGNLHIAMPISVQALTAYLLLDNEGIINKTRNIYLNQLDFYCLDLPLLGDEHNMPHKEIMAVIVLPEVAVPEGSFYYATNDEWEILKSTK